MSLMYPRDNLGSLQGQGFRNLQKSRSPGVGSEAQITTVVSQAVSEVKNWECCLHIRTTWETLMAKQWPDPLLK